MPMFVSLFTQYVAICVISYVLANRLFLGQWNHPKIRTKKQLMAIADPCLFLKSIPKTQPQRKQQRSCHILPYLAISLYLPWWYTYHYLPLWKMMEWKSVGMMTFPTEWKVTKIHGSINHQPDTLIKPYIYIYSIIFPAWQQKNTMVYNYHGINHHNYGATKNHGFFILRFPSAIVSHGHGPWPVPHWWRDPGPTRPRAPTPAPRSHISVSWRNVWFTQPGYVNIAIENGPVEIVDIYPWKIWFIFND